MTTNHGAGRLSREQWAIVGLTIAAAALRLWRLDAIPPGLHVDEAYNILDAQAVVAGARPVFLPANAGRDVLYTYLQAPLIAAFGPTVWAARLASALVGIATVPVVWWTARRLLAGMGHPHPRRFAPPPPPGGAGDVVAFWTAVAAAGLVAFSYWHLHFSRFGIRAVLFPLVVCGVVAAWRGAVGAGPHPPGPPLPSEWERGEVAQVGVRGVLVGVMLGVAFYSHPAGRGLVALPAIHAVYRWLRWRDRRALGVLAVAVVAMLIVAAPLLLFWYRAAWTFTSHAEEVSVLGHGAAAVAANVGRVLGMFNFEGDAARWRNLPGRPALDEWTGLAFLAGLVWTAVAAWRGHDGAALALLWLGVLLVPSMATDNAPNFSRAIGALPAVCVVAAVGLQAMAAFGARGRAETALLALLLGFTAISTTYEYFVVWARHPDTPLAFDADKQALGEYYRRESAAGTFVYLSPAMMDHPTVMVAAGTKPSGFDPHYQIAEGFALPVDAQRQGVFATLPSDTTVQGISSGSGQFLWASPPESESMQGVSIDIYHPDDFMLNEVGRNRWSGGAVFPDFAPHFRLAGLKQRAEVRAGQEVPVTLVWDVLRPTDVPLHTAVQLQSLGGAGLGHGDGPPLRGSYPTDRWRPGERIISIHRLHVDADAPAGPAELRIGWYAPPVGDRPFQPLVLDDQGTTVRVVGRIEVVR